MSTIYWISVQDIYRKHANVLLNTIVGRLKKHVLRAVGNSEFLRFPDSTFLLINLTRCTKYALLVNSVRNKVSFIDNSIALGY